MIDRGTRDLFFFFLLCVRRVFISIARRWWSGSAVGHQNEVFMASVSEDGPKLVQVSNIHARVTVKWPFGVPPTCLIRKRSAQVGSPSNGDKNATRLFCFV